MPREQSVLQKLFLKEYTAFPIDAVNQLEVLCLDYRLRGVRVLFYKTEELLHGHCLYVGFRVRQLAQLKTVDTIVVFLEDEVIFLPCVFLGVPDRVFSPTFNRPEYRYPVALAEIYYIYLGDSFRHGVQNNIVSYIYSAM